MACVFLFYFKIFMQSRFTYIYTISLLICFKVQMTPNVQLGLDKPMKSIFEPEGDFNNFDKFIRLTQNGIFKITSKS